MFLCIFVPKNNILPIMVSFAFDERGVMCDDQSDDSDFLVWGILGTEFEHWFYLKLLI